MRTYKYDSLSDKRGTQPTIARLHGHDKRTLRMTYGAVTSESPRLILLLPYNERTREKSRDPPVMSDRERRNGNIIGGSTLTGRLPVAGQLRGVRPGR